MAKCKPTERARIYLDVMQNYERDLVRPEIKCLGFLFTFKNSTAYPGLMSEYEPSQFSYCCMGLVEEMGPTDQSY